MSETSPYINTFALITFEFDNPKDSVKYEYYVENPDAEIEDDSLNIITVKPDNDDDQDDSSSCIKQYWIVQVVVGDKFDYHIISEDLSETVETMQMKIGPFQDEMLAQLCLDALRTGD